MGGPSLQAPLTESIIDLQLVPRQRVLRPYSWNYIEPDYDAPWTVNSGTGAVAVSAGGGSLGEDILVLTTTGDNGNNELRSGALPANIPALGTTGMLCVRVMANHVNRIGDLSFLGFQGGFVNGMESDPATGDVAIEDNQWRLVPILRQSHPIVADVAAPNWGAVIDRLEVNVQDAGGGVDGVLQLSLGAWYYHSTAGINRRGVSIFFDEAWVSAYDQAVYCLEHGVGIAIVVKPWDYRGRDRLNHHGYMSLRQIRALYNAGAEVCVTSDKDLTSLSRQERLNELAALKRWTFKHNFLEGNDMFVYPDGNYDYWTGFDVMRFFAAARTREVLPLTVAHPEPLMRWAMPCLGVTDESTQDLADHVTYGTADEGGAAWFSFRGFSAAASAGDFYNITDFQTFINALDDDESCPPLAMVTQGI